MNANDWSRVRAAFERALELPLERREAALDEALGCGTTERAEAQRLLVAAAAEGPFLEPPGPATLPELRGSDAVPAPMPARLGPFRLQRVIARGGMGTVFLAEQEHPERTVAVKVVDAASAGARTRERFRAEIDTLARLHHPGIAEVYEAGVEPDGTAWFAMDYLADALPITEFARRRALGLAARLRLFLQVCGAVEHAHQRGVIHRDLKPGNILVAPHGDGVVKVIDFGIARVLDPGRTAHTLAGELLGTLAYMSPEQLDGGDTDVRTDVYGLGVVLYELVTGEVPIAVADLPLQVACRRVLEVVPEAVSVRRAGLPRELDWIVLEALRKQRDARYGSVHEFAEDVRRCLRHEPVSAGPDSASYRLRMFVRRNRAAAAAGGIVALVTVVALVMVTLALLRTQRAETAERAGRQAAERSAASASAALDFLLDVFSAVDPGKDGREVRMADALGRAAHDFGERFADQPQIRSALGETIGNAYFGLGLLGEAEHHLAECVPIHVECHGERSREVCRALEALAYVQLRRGELGEAEATIERAAADAAAVGDELLELEVAARAADVQRARGDRAGAVAALRPIVARLRELRGDGDRATIQAIGVLAVALHELGDLDAAEPLCREVRDGTIAQKGEDHPDSLTAINNHIALLYSRGRLADMQPLLERLVHVRQRVLGDDHPDTIGTINNLAAVSYRLHDFATAARWFGECLDRMDRASEVPPTSQTYLAVLANLAAAERELGHYDRSIELGERALGLKIEVYGRSHDSTLQTMTMLADAYRQQGDFDHGLEMFTACRALAAAGESPQLANVYRCDLGLARCHAGRREFEQAEQLLLRCRDTYDASDAAATSRGMLTRPESDLIGLYEASGRSEEAARLRAAAEPTAAAGKR